MPDVEVTRGQALSPDPEATRGQAPSPDPEATRGQAPSPDPEVTCGQAPCCFCVSVFSRLQKALCLPVASKMASNI